VSGALSLGPHWFPMCSATTKQRARQVRQQQVGRSASYLSFFPRQTASDKILARAILMAAGAQLSSPCGTRGPMCTP
jgi:hypothetical protein